MKQDKVVALLSFLNSKKTGYRAGWVVGHCPRIWKHGGKDNTPSFAIQDTDKKKSRCHCWSCGFSGDLTDLLMDVGVYVRKHQLPGYDISMASQLISTEFEDLEFNPDGIPDYDEAPEKIETVFSEQWLKSFKTIDQFPEAVEYCQGRGLDSQMMQRLDLRYDAKQRRVCFPFRNFKGELMGVQGRAIDKTNDLRYYQYGYTGKRNPHIWMNESNLNLDDPVVLCEGPFDLASIARVYSNVAASFTSGISKSKLMRVASGGLIISFYDYGTGGDAARETITKYLPGYPVIHIIPTEQEDDAGNLPVQSVASYLQPHVQ